MKAGSVKRTRGHASVALVVSPRTASSSTPKSAAREPRKRLQEEGEPKVDEHVAAKRPAAGPYNGGGIQLEDIFQAARPPQAEPSSVEAIEDSDDAVAAVAAVAAVEAAAACENPHELARKKIARERQAHHESELKKRKEEQQRQRALTEQQRRAALDEEAKEERRLQNKHAVAAMRNGEGAPDRVVRPMSSHAAPTGSFYGSHPQPLIGQRFALSSSARPAPPRATYGAPRPAVKQSSGYPAPPPARVLLQSTLVPPQRSPESPRPAGMRNLGNTCYMNAVLQMLMSIEGFTRQFRDDEMLTSMMASAYEAAGVPEQASDSFVLGFAQFVNATRSARTAVDPSRLKRLLGKHNARFEGFAQEDAHEFFSNLINAIDDEQTALLPDCEHGVAYDAFSLAIAHRLVCVECADGKEIVEDYLDLSLELVADDEPGARRMQHSVLSLLEHFMQKEDDVEWKCPHADTCSQQRAALTHRLRRLPATLVLHLKRFDHSLHRKLFTAVTIPEYLDVGTVAAREAPGARRYRLRALVLHLGHTIHGGHFVCHARGDDGRWRKFDDSVVSNLTAFEAFNNVSAQQNAYLICYEQEQLPPTPQQPQPLQPQPPQ